jgi:quercetin dioxygenase-like cupin family protein
MRGAVGMSLVVAALMVPLTSMAQERGPVVPAPILREIVAGMPRGERQEVRVIVATLQPGQATPFHQHRFPVAGYVLEGAFTLEMEGRAPITIKAGEAMLEPAQVQMTGYNRSATEPLKVVIFYVSDPDTPFLDPVHR